MKGERTNPSPPRMACWALSHSSTDLPPHYGFVGKCGSLCLVLGGFVGQGFRNPPELVYCWVPIWFDSLCQHSNCPWSIAWIFNYIYLNFVALLHWETESSYLFVYEIGKRNANCAPLCCSRQFPKLLSQSDFLIFKTLSTSLDQ